jgi:hypothetical protein
MLEAVSRVPVYTRSEPSSLLQPAAATRVHGSI